MYTIQTNKHHYDKGIKFHDHSEKSVRLSKMIDGKENSKFIPKSQIKIFELQNGDVEIQMEDWLFDKELKSETNPDGWFDLEDSM